MRKRIEKENITVDMASSLAGNAGRKKLRSKSIGPGGLDGLKAGAGNRRVVSVLARKTCSSADSAQIVAGCALKATSQINPQADDTGAARDTAS